MALTKVPFMVTMATRTTGIWPPQKIFLGGSPAGGHSGSADASGRSRSADSRGSSGSADSRGRS